MLTAVYDTSKRKEKSAPRLVTSKEMTEFEREMLVINWFSMPVEHFGARIIVDNFLLHAHLFDVKYE
jgi:hypothetical protein